MKSIKAIIALCLLWYGTQLPGFSQGDQVPGWTTGPTAFSYHHRSRVSDSMDGGTVAVVADSNVPLSGLGPIDGYALTDGELVLLIGQTDGRENGPWRVTAGGWVRPSDYSIEGRVDSGRCIYVERGDEYGTCTYQLITDTPLGVCLQVDVVPTIWRKKDHRTVGCVECWEIPGDSEGCETNTLEVWSTGEGGSGIGNNAEFGPYIKPQEEVRGILEDIINSCPPGSGVRISAGGSEVTFLVDHLYFDAGGTNLFLIDETRAPDPCGFYTFGPADSGDQIPGADYDGAIAWVVGRPPTNVPWALIDNRDPTNQITVASGADFGEFISNMEALGYTEWSFGETHYFCPCPPGLVQAGDYFVTADGNTVSKPACTPLSEIESAPDKSLFNAEIPAGAQFECVELTPAGPAAEYCVVRFTDGTIAVYDRSDLTLPPLDEIPEGAIECGSDVEPPHAVACIECWEIPGEGEFAKSVRTFDPDRGSRHDFLTNAGGTVWTIEPNSEGWIWDFLGNVVGQNLEGCDFAVAHVQSLTFRNRDGWIYIHRDQISSGSGGWQWNPAVQTHGGCSVEDIIGALTEQGLDEETAKQIVLNGFTPGYLSNTGTNELNGDFNGGALPAPFGMCFNVENTGAEAQRFCVVRCADGTSIIYDRDNLVGGPLPALPEGAVEVPCYDGFADVAFSGDYNDLINTPVIPEMPEDELDWYRRDGLTSAASEDMGTTRPQSITEDIYREGSVHIGQGLHAPAELVISGPDGSAAGANIVSPSGRNAYVGFVTDGGSAAGPPSYRGSLYLDQVGHNTLRLRVYDQPGGTPTLTGTVGLENIAGVGGDVFEFDANDAQFHKYPNTRDDTATEPQLNVLYTDAVGELQSAPFAPSNQVAMVNVAGQTNLNAGPTTDFVFNAGSLATPTPAAFTATAGGIQVTDAGWYLVSVNAHFTSAVQRGNVRTRITVNGTEVGPHGASGYMRGWSGHNESSTHITPYLVQLNAGDLIGVHGQRYANAGTIAMAANQGTLTVELKSR